MLGSEIRNIGFREVRRPLRTTFTTSIGSKDRMLSIVVVATLRDGSKGGGECATSLVLPDESPDVIKSVLRKEGRLLQGLNIADFPDIISVLRCKYPSYPMTISGLEVALFRAWLDHVGVEERDYFGGGLNHIETDITVPFTTNPDLLRAWLDRCVKKGFRIYKIKVSGNITEDKRLVALVAALINRFCDDYLLRLDGNQGFTARTCLAFLEHIERKKYPVELFEQPLRKNDHRGLREVTQRSCIPVILDETVFTVPDMEHAIDKNLGHGVNIKTAKSGISDSLAILGLAKRCGLRVMMGCMTETMMGLSAGINLAMGLGSFDYIDLDSVHFLYSTAKHGKLRIKGPWYEAG